MNTYVMSDDKKYIQEEDNDTHPVGGKIQPHGLILGAEPGAIPHQGSRTGTKTGELVSEQELEQLFYSKIIYAGVLIDEFCQIFRDKQERKKLEKKLLHELTEAQIFMQQYQSSLHTDYLFQAAFQHYISVLSRVEIVLNTADQYDVEPDTIKEGQIKFDHRKDEPGVIRKLKEKREEQELILPDWVLDYLADLLADPNVLQRAWNRATAHELNEEYEQYQLKSTVGNYASRILITEHVAKPLLLHNTEVTSEQDAQLNRTKNAFKDVRDEWLERYTPVAHKYDLILEYLPDIVTLLKAYYSSDDKNKLNIPQKIGELRHDFYVSLWHSTHVMNEIGEQYSQPEQLAQHSQQLQEHLDTACRLLKEYQETKKDIGVGFKESEYQERLDKYMESISMAERLMNDVDSLIHAGLTDRVGEVDIRESGSVYFGDLEVLNNKHQLGLPRWIIRYVSSFIDKDTVRSLSEQEDSLDQVYEDLPPEFGRERRLQLDAITIPMIMRAANSHDVGTIESALEEYSAHRAFNTLSHLKQEWGGKNNTDGRFSPVAIKYNHLAQYLPYILELVALYYASTAQKSS